MEHYLERFNEKFEDTQLSFLHAPVIDNVLQKHAVQKLNAMASPVPNIYAAVSNPWEQFKAFLLCPHRASWTLLAESAAGVFMSTFAMQGKGVDVNKLQSALGMWRAGYSAAPVNEDGGDWLWLSRISLSEDMLAYALSAELTVQQFDRLRLGLRLDDSHDERKKALTYTLRWRQFLAMLNFFQFANNLTVFTTSEVLSGIAPELPLDLGAGLTADWEDVLEEAASYLDSLVRAMAAAGCALPEVAFETEDVGFDAIAEFAWPEASTPTTLLVGDQVHLSHKWANAGWKIFTEQDVQALGEQVFVDQLATSVNV